MLSGLGAGLPHIARVLDESDDTGAADALAGHAAALREERERLTRQIAAAYARGDSWWRGMSAEQKSAWQQRAADLARDWASAAESGIGADSPAALELARRHVAWLDSIPGTPSRTQVRAYVMGLGGVYVADPRFAANDARSAGGSACAEFARDALRAYAEREL